MKYLFITIAAVVLVVCGDSKQSDPPTDEGTVEPVVEAESPTLHEAASSGDIDIVKQFLDAGANVNAKENLTGWTPLVNATSSGDEGSS